MDFCCNTWLQCSSPSWADKAILRLEYCSQRRMPLFCFSACLSCLWLGCSPLKYTELTSPTSNLTWWSWIKENSPGNVHWFNIALAYFTKLLGIMLGHLFPVLLSQCACTLIGLSSKRRIRTGFPKCQSKHAVCVAYTRFHCAQPLL